MNAVQSSDVFRVGIICPKGAKTGGPEALHQLCDSLTRIGVDAKLINLGEEVEPVQEYAQYEAPWGDREELDQLDYLVIPETALRVPKFVDRNFHGKYIVWWLSVDNADEKCAHNFERKTFPISREWPSEVQVRKLSALGNQIAKWRDTSKKFVTGNRRLRLENAYHIAQSHYAQKFLIESHSLESMVVSDYVRKVVENAPLERPGQITVVYNPAKGGTLVDAVKKSSKSSISYIPLSNMSGQEVRKTMQIAHLYLDLGHFPGRDRMPREAISLGCPVVIAARGAGRYFQDFPLADKFKINLATQTPEAVAKRIEEILAEGNSVVGQQSEFYKFVESDRTRFDQEVEAWVSQLMAAGNND